MAINLKLLNEEIENSRPIRTNRFVRTNFKVGNDDLRKLLVALKRADSISRLNSEELIFLLWRFFDIQIGILIQ